MLGATVVRTLARMMSALLLAAVLDPNCVPRHHPHPRAFAYHAHYYHAPPPPACREPWQDPHLRDIKVAELPYSPVPAEPLDLAHSPSVIWLGYVQNPAHEPHGAPGARAPVSLPEPSTLGLFGVSAAALFALRQRSGRRS
jgi:hypothetical protein